MSEEKEANYKKTSRVPIWAWVLIISFFLIIGGCVYFSSTVDEKTSENKNITDSNTDKIVQEYEYLGVVSSTGAGKSYGYLLTSSDKSEEYIETLATEIKKEKCSQACIINIYDDEEAFNLDKEYSVLTTSEEMTKWQEDNYVYVAEHFIAYLDFSDLFFYYPFKDGYYEELKNK